MMAKTFSNLIKTINTVDPRITMKTKQDAIIPYQSTS